MTDSLDEMLAGMVRELQWREEVSGTWWTADIYRIEQFDGGGYAVRIRDGGAWRTIAFGLPFAEAKAAAESDYRSRIISALNPDILRWMRDALQPFADACLLLERAEDDAPAGGWVVVSGSDAELVPRVRDFRRAQTALRSLSPKDPSNGK